MRFLAIVSGASIARRGKTSQARVTTRSILILLHVPRIRAEGRPASATEAATERPPLPAAAAAHEAGHVRALGIHLQRENSLLPAEKKADKKREEKEEGGGGGRAAEIQAHELPGAPRPDAP